MCLEYRLFLFSSAVEPPSSDWSVDVLCHFPSQAPSLCAPLPVVGVCMGRVRRGQVELSTPHLSLPPVLLGMLSCLLLTGTASPAREQSPQGTGILPL